MNCNFFAISKDFSLPIGSVTQTFAILAKRGVGKTYTGSVMAEEMLSQHQQIVVLDPTGAWHGLRSSANGGAPGYRIVVIGGENADIPLEEAAGELIAQAIVENGFSAIIDLSVLRKAAVRRFVTPFLETLYRLNRKPLHLFVDEADDICPQKPFGDEAAMVGALEDVVKRGRRKGIGCTLITQRPADLAKQVLTQVEVLISMRISHHLDIKAINAWVNVHADPEQAGDMLKSLPSLPVGTAWIWSPGWLNVFQKVQIRKRHTYDSSATPEVGGEGVSNANRVTSIVDIKTLGAQILAMKDRIKADDPRELKRRIRELEAAMSKRQTPPAPTAIPAAVLDQVERVRTELLHLAGSMESIHVVLDAFGQNAAPPNEASLPTIEEVQSIFSSKAPSCAQVSRSFQTMKSGGIKRMLTALAQSTSDNQMMNTKQLGLRAGMSSKSGTFSTYLATMRSNGWIDGDGSGMYITIEGRKAIGKVEALPEGRDLGRYWINFLGGGAGRMLEVLIEAHPKSLSKEELGERANLSPASGTFSTYLSKLRKLQVVEGRDLRASDDLV